MASIRGHYASNNWTFMISILLQLCVVRICSEMSGMQSLCEGESFQGQCSRDEVVVMETAFYGRMRLGKCVQMNMGYIGCEADVLGRADARCSGRKSCTINVPDTDFEKTRPCYELKSYLEVSYTCVRVATGRSSVCQKAKYIKLTSSAAYLSSEVTQSTGCGTALCPWVIEVPEGQRINLTLLDFGWRARSSGSALGPGGAVSDYNTLQGCQKYAVLREMSETRSITICGSAQRVSHQYISDSSKLEVYLTPSSAPDAAHFMLKYEAIGCPDLNPPMNAQFQRTNAERGVVRCKYSEQSWPLECKGTIWVGSVGNCTHYEPRNSQFLIGSMSMPHGIAVAIVAGVAIVIGMLILTVGLVIFKRHMRRKEEEEEERAHGQVHCPPDSVDCTYREDFLTSSSERGNYGSQRRQQQSNQKHYDPVIMIPGGISKNEYTHIWQMPLPTPRSDPSSHNLTAE